MRCMERNKRIIYFCSFMGKTPITDVNGYETGEYALSYSAVTPLRATVSVSKGNVLRDRFGMLADYDRVLIVDDPHCPIDEQSVIFIDNPPTSELVGTVEVDSTLLLDDAGNPLYDYIVERAYPSINFTAYGLKRVSVS